MGKHNYMKAFLFYFFKQIFQKFKSKLHVTVKNEYIFCLLTTTLP